jgi:3',5'-cyclic AMP phosphodiesterase CpdA
MPRKNKKESGPAFRVWRRRARMVLFAALAVVAGPTPSSAEPKAAAAESLFFIQMADTQFGMFATPLLFSYLGLSWSDDEFEEETRLFEKATESANRMGPAFVIVCGDLVNKPGHAGQAAGFKRISQKLSLDIPLYLVAGNHDVGNEPTRESLEWYRATFGKDWYSFRHGDVHGIVLNSTIIREPEHVTRAVEEQLEWLKAELEEARSGGAAHLLVFQHHPLFLETPDEDDDYFNLPLEQRKIYLDLFRRHGVEAVFAGHSHRNSYARAGAMQMITTGPVGKPLGDDPSGFRVVRVLEDRIEHEYRGLDTTHETPREPD